MTQKDLSTELHTSHQSISNYERGQRFCDLDTLVQVSELFDISIDDLLKKNYIKPILFLQVSDRLCNLY